MLAEGTESQLELTTDDVGGAEALTELPVGPMVALILGLPTGVGWPVALTIEFADGDRLLAGTCVK